MNEDTYPERRQNDAPTAAQFVTHLEQLNDLAPAGHVGGLHGYVSRPGPSCHGVMLEGLAYTGPTTDALREYVRAEFPAADEQTIDDDRLYIWFD